MLRITGQLLLHSLLDRMSILTEIVLPYALRRQAY